MQHPTYTRAFILEDLPESQEWLTQALSQAFPGIAVEVCASVGDARVHLAQCEAPQVALIDLGLPDGSGLDVIRHAVRLHPACEPLVISMFGDEDNVLASIEAGALGYIHKDSTPEDIAHAIREMKAGASPISPMIARRVLSKYLSLRDGRAAAPVPAPAPAAGPAARALLSAREQEVLELIARGFSYAEIARLQAVSVHTVQTHIKNLYRKLAVRSRGEAVFEATQLGLLGRAVA